MIFKHLLLASALCLGAGSALAEGEYLHIQTSSGWEVLPIEKVSKLTFNDGFMTATDASNSQLLKVKQGDLGMMMVSETPQSASVTLVNDEEGNFVFDPATKSVKFLQSGDFAIYTLAGAKLLEIPAVREGETVNIAAIDSEVVIIKSGSYAIKAILK